MQVFTEIMPLRSFLAEKKSQNFKIGLVPTMGALHDGHLKLVEECTKSCDITVVSIFVNPKQFNDSADFENYPNLIDQDLEKLGNLEVDVVYNPESAEMYPEETCVSIGFGKLEESMEGYFRPNHFGGVGLVVSKLFNIVSPDVAFFGQKDFQQLALIRKLNADLSFGIEIVSVPTVRENDGLAMSSRNLRLTEEERTVAPVIYKTLNLLKEELLSGKTVEDSRRTAKTYIESHRSIRLEYLEVVDSNSLAQVFSVDQHSQVSLCIAAYLGDVRLIDNLYLFSR